MYDHTYIYSFYLCPRETGFLSPIPLRHSLTDLMDAVLLILLVFLFDIPDDVVEHIDGAVKVGEITELLRAEYAVVTGKHLLFRVCFFIQGVYPIFIFFLPSRWAIKRRAADHHIPGQVQLWHPCRGELPEAYCIPDVRPCVSNTHFQRRYYFFL